MYEADGDAARDLSLLFSNEQFSTHQNRLSYVSRYGVGRNRGGKRDSN
jgi:hypothetical protein